METTKLRKFAQFARRSLIEQVKTKLTFVLADGSLARRENPKAVKDLEEQIAARGKAQVVETVAYTWFNRFCALRYMDVNRYTRIGVVSPVEGQFQPEILAEAKMGHMDEELVPTAIRDKVDALLNETTPSKDPQGEAYRLLLVAACNHYHKLMPFMFEKIADYTELLMPDDLLSGNSILAYTREALLPANCSPKYTDQSVEVIGWLYQFYISEKKDDVFAALKKGKKITPENIPAATQLFTPHWIVRYLVENSLGRLWMLNHPDSRLIEQMDYYIRPETPETDFLRISSPGEIKICDPACGSGHMLTYAFDLLYAIYEEQGYEATEIPRLILENNLHGIEIDQRAGALAAFALAMKGREKYPRFLSTNKMVQPNICVLENVHIDPQQFNEYMDKVGRDLFTGGLQGVVHQFEEANNFGSLIRPAVTDVSEVLELLRERQVGEDLFLARVHQKVLKALKQAGYLSPKYHVVVANPPYMGVKSINPQMKDFGAKHFPDSKSDSFAMFIERGFDLVYVGGYSAMVTMQSWMFLSSYERLRNRLLREVHMSSMVHMGNNVMGIAFGTAATIWRNSTENHAPSHFSHVSTNDLDSKGVPTDFPISNERLRSVPQTYFLAFPGVPIAYWASVSIRAAFERSTSLAELAEIRQGLATCNNDLFTRLWHEIDIKKIGFGFVDGESAKKSGQKWFPYNKGGSFRQWYGNNENVVNWQNGGEAIHEYSDLPMDYAGAPVRAKQFYFKEGITYGLISSFGFSARRVFGGFVFDVGGSMIFPSIDIDKLQGFLSSKLVKALIGVLNPTLNYQVGDVQRLPVDVDAIAKLDWDWSRPIAISKKDWDSFETSWDFASLELLSFSDSSLELRYENLAEVFSQRVSEMKALQNENNDLYITAYGVGDSVDGRVEDSDVTLDCNPHYRYGSDKNVPELESLLLADTMREFISYAVGCMLGRYSLDKPGLILANQGETAHDYFRLTILDFGLEGEYDPSRLEECMAACSFPPDEDNVIPMLDGDWFTDDITERFNSSCELHLVTSTMTRILGSWKTPSFPKTRRPANARPSATTS